MTVSVTDVAQAIKYLHAAGAMNAVDDQEVVWADYINDEKVGVPDALSVDMLPAARLCIKRWAAQDGNYRRNVAVVDYAEALASAQAARVTEVVGFAYNQAWPEICPVFTQTYDGIDPFSDRGPYWQNVVREIANTNTDRDEVYRLALEQILRDTDHTLDKDRLQPVWVQETYGVGIPGPEVPETARVGTVLGEVKKEIES